MEYFQKPRTPAQRQYCALAAYYKDGIPAREVAAQYGYTLSSFYSLVRDFGRRMKEKGSDDPFFRNKKPGRKVSSEKPHLERTVVALRNCDLSNAQIYRAMRALDLQISQAEIWRILSRCGYEKLPRRSRKAIAATETVFQTHASLRRAAGQPLRLKDVSTGKSGV
ncbi:MAG: hypothetical protein GF410_12190 [Chitinivibrionales bacterium]|nr:hypothetical protein [Chitinivibrionales bacterium]